MKTTAIIVLSVATGIAMWFNGITDTIDYKLLATLIVLQSLAWAIGFGNGYGQRDQLAHDRVIGMCPAIGKPCDCKDQ